MTQQLPTKKAKKDITLDDIIAGMKAKNNTFDAEGIDRKYHEQFPDELKHFTLVKPFEVESQVTTGSSIRYIKKNSDDISCAAIVVKVEYSALDDTLDHFVLSNLTGKKNIWKIYPSNHYIFKYSSAIGDQKRTNNIKKVFDKEKEKMKEIVVPVDTHKKVLKRMGMNDEDIEHAIELDKKVDEIISSNTTNTKKKSYIKKVNDDTIDDILDTIITQHDSDTALKNNNKKKEIKKRK